MKKISCLFLLIITVIGYSQSPNTIVTTIEQESNGLVFDGVTVNHKLGMDNPSPLLAEGFQLITTGDHKEAVRILSLALDESKDHPEFIYFFRGIAKHALGEYRGAVVDFTRSLLINSQMADAYFRRAIAHHELGEDESAKSDFHKTTIPGKTLYTTTSDDVIETIEQFNSETQLDTLTAGL